MRRASEFREVMASGRKVRRKTLIVHHRPAVTTAASSGGCIDPRGCRHAPVVGLVVGRAVGGSVVRHRVSRRLRAELAQRLTLLAPSSATVVRALPAAAEADSATLGADLQAALVRLASTASASR
jgi:ribonuclease P protein component